MSRKNEPVCITERIIISDLMSAGVVAYQGRQSFMEDNYKIISIKGTDISLFAVCDGHAGNFASQYTSDIIVPIIADKIEQIFSIAQKRIQKLLKEKKAKRSKVKAEQINEITESEEIEENPLEKYVTSDNKINYDQLLHDEILEADKILLDRMGRAAQFGGSTLCLVIVDITNKAIVCANVGDSRAIYRDTKGIAVEMSDDHKPDRKEELIRIKENGGFISNMDGCWRVEGSLATSRALGDYPLKLKKVIIADPEIRTFTFKEFRNFPRFIIVASDGLWDVFKNQEACDYAKDKLKETHFGARSLMKKAYAKKSCDNITVIVVKFIKPPKKPVSKNCFDPYAGTYEWLR